MTGFYIAFRKPITTLGSLFWWKNIKQDSRFILQEHKIGMPAWPYKYRITLRENRMEIANSNDVDEIMHDWAYLQENVDPQLDQKIDVGAAIAKIDLQSIVDQVLKK